MLTCCDCSLPKSKDILDTIQPCVHIRTRLQLAARFRCLATVRRAVCRPCGAAVGRGERCDRAVLGLQVNLDFASEGDMVQMLRVGLALQPIATALFANSPFHGGRPSGFLSWRSKEWEHLVSHCCPACQ